MNRSNCVGTLRVLWGILAFSIVAGCIEDVAPLDEEDVASSIAALSPADWSAPAVVGADRQGARHAGAIATLNGVTYMVHSGDCDDCHALWWTKLGPNGWTNDVQIPNQLAADKVSLAAFNGYLYMVHTGDSDTSAVWVSRFNPATEQWSPNYESAYRSRETPAIMAYRGRLYMVGINTSAPYTLWMATLDTSDNLSAQTLLNQWSTTRASLAVYNGRLYIAHRHQASNLIVYNYYDGANWEWNRPIPVGDGTSLEGPVPVIASHDGFLHLVVKRPGSNALWWTTFDGTTWATPATLGTMTSYAYPGLGNGGTGLVLSLTRRCPSGHVCYAKNMLLTSQYRSPPNSGGGFEFELGPIDTLAP